MTLPTGGRYDRADVAGMKYPSVLVGFLPKRGENHPERTEYRLGGSVRLFRRYPFFYDLFGGMDLDPV